MMPGEFIREDNQKKIKIMEKGIKTIKNEQ
ncbi:MAG: hypothetical protein JWP81_3556 [Ferruginibacter sp.]|nr:hypothetical protein [Ferruginibacter sp.]